MAALNLKRNSAFNLAGGVIPALASLAVMPIIVHGLGGEGYGLLVLITSILGYFALLDVNVTAGSTKFIAEHHAHGDDALVSQTINFGLMIYLAIGLIGAMLLFMLSGWLAGAVFNVAPAQHALAASCLKVAAVGFLFGQIQTYLQSIPQALMRYDLTFRFEVSFGLAVSLGSVALLHAGFGLLAIIWLRVILSIVNVVLLATSIYHLMPRLRWHMPQRQTVRAMTHFSAYSFLSRVAALSYAHGDKLIIGAVVGMKPLAVYAVAATVGNRVLGMMYRVSAVLLPAASSLSARGDEARLQVIYLKISRYVVYVNLSALLLLGVFAEPLLRHWIGAEYSVGGALVLQLVALGQFVDSLTNLPSLVNDGRGHPRVTGLFALSRAVLGLALVFGLVQAFGIVGAAWGHLLSALIMTTVFVGYVHGRTVPVALPHLLRRSWAAPVLGASAVAAFTALAYQHTSGSVRYLLSLAAVAMGVLAVYGWCVVLLPDDRLLATGWLRTRFRGSA